MGAVASAGSRAEPVSRHISSAVRAAAGVGRAEWAVSVGVGIERAVAIRLVEWPTVGLVEGAVGLVERAVGVCVWIRWLWAR